jgi:N-acetylmuramoyl-L-alanine amidase
MRAAHGRRPSGYRRRAAGICWGPGGWPAGRLWLTLRLRLVRATGAGALLAALAALAPQPAPQPTPARDRPPLGGMVAVVDAGHGGVDPGAVAAGVREKDVNLAVALATAAELRAMGARVTLTRSDDRHLATGDQRYYRDRRRRAEIAAAAKADVFVSIHANMVGWSTARGPMVIWSPNGRPEGRLLAEAIQDAMRRALDFPTGIRQLPIKVLEWSGVPAVLVETGFLSNPRDRALLQDPAYQRRLAAAIADGVRAYWTGGRFGRLLLHGWLWAAAP